MPVQTDPLSEPANSQALKSIADSVKGTFQTVESMTHSFIREAILQGFIQPGERINQDGVAEILGVSRMPVRAALRHLEAEGLVTIYPHRGATVSVLQRHEIAEIYELRALIEGHLLELAVRNLTDDVVAELEELVQPLDTETPTAERLEWRQDFYGRLYELADRPRALAMANQLRASVGRYLLLVRPDDLEKHDDLMKYLRAREAEAAKEWLMAHLAKISRKIQEVAPEAQERRRS
jgi:DNA-binding GntR family transcriptional regulator